MRFGLCTQADQIELARETGFDYVELPLAQIAALDEADFAALQQQATLAGLPVEACNIFFPRNIRLTGHDADLPAAKAYARVALQRAAALGARVVVFGSGGARNVPEGFPMEQAWAQLIELLRDLDAIAGESGITIAIEHLNRAESNIVTSVADGLRLAQEVNKPHIQVLADSYHMLRENEDPAVILRTRGALAHVHVARGEGRLYPSEPDDQLRAFFAALRQAGYDGRASIEGRSDEMHGDALRSLTVLRALTAG